MALAADITAASVCWLSRQGDPTTFFHLVLKNPLTRQIRWNTQITPRFFCKGRNLRPQSKYALQAPPPGHQADLRCQLKIRCRIRRSEEHTSELQSLMRISYAVFCLKKKNTKTQQKK